MEIHSFELNVGEKGIVKCKGTQHVLEERQKLTLTAYMVGKHK